MYGERAICEGPFDAPRDNGDICITTTRNAAVFFEALEGFTKDNIKGTKDVQNNKGKFIFSSKKFRQVHLKRACDNQFYDHNRLWFIFLSV